MLLLLQHGRVPCALLTFLRLRSCGARVPSHDVLKLRPQRLDGTELVANLPRNKRVSSQHQHLDP